MSIPAKCTAASRKGGQKFEGHFGPITGMDIKAPMVKVPIDC